MINNPKRVLALTLAVFLANVIVLALVGCSLLTKQETTQSSIPSAATLQQECANGAKQSPPIRAGACDDYNAVSALCLAQIAQPVPQAALLQLCNAGGYPLTGTFTRL